MIPSMGGVPTNVEDGGPIKVHWKPSRISYNIPYYEYKDPNTTHG